MLLGPSMCETLDVAVGEDVALSPRVAPLPIGRSVSELGAEPILNVLAPTRRPPSIFDPEPVVVTTMKSSAADC